MSTLLLSLCANALCCALLLVWLSTQIIAERGWCLKGFRWATAVEGCTTYDDWHDLTLQISQYHSQLTDTSIFSVWACHTDAARPSLLRCPEHINFELAVLVYRCVHGLVPRYLSDYYIQHVTDSSHHCVRSSSSSQLDPTYTAVHCRRLCISGGWKLPLEQSATWCHLSSKADCFSEPPQNLPFLPIIS